MNKWRKAIVGIVAVAVLTVLAALSWSMRHQAQPPMPTMLRVRTMTDPFIVDAPWAATSTGTIAISSANAAIWSNGISDRKLKWTVGDRGCIVSINYNGKVDLGNCKDADDAARTFWKSVEDNSPCKIGKP